MHLDLAAATANQTAVLADEGILRVLRRDRTWLLGKGDRPLIDVLGETPEAQAWWRAALAGHMIKLLDPNTVEVDCLRRIPGLPTPTIEGLIAGRPYFSVAEIALRLPSNVPGVASLRHYLAVHDFAYWDKISSQRITLRPADDGCVFVWDARSSSRQIQETLASTLALPLRHLPEERISVAIALPAAERARLFRGDAALPGLRTMAPILIDRDGLRRLVHPFRLEVRCHPRENESAKGELAADHHLRLLNNYDAHSFAADVEAERHDLSALYRSLDCLVADDRVDFAEPYFLDADLGRL